MFLFQKGQTIDNRYTVVFPHKEGAYAETYSAISLPQRFLQPPSGHTHSGRVNNWILGEQCLDVLSECIGRIDGIEPVGDVAEVGVEFVWCELPICNPCVGKSAWKAGINDNDSIPKARVVSTDVTNNGDATQPTTHVLKLWDAKTTADSFFCSTVVHVAIEFGKCSHRCDLHRFPYWRHRRTVVFPKMFLDVLVFRTVQLFLQVSKISIKQIAVFCQSRVHKPESTMQFCKDANHSGSDCNLYLLNGGKEKYAQLFVTAIKTQYLGESRTGLENVLPSVSLHQSPVARQTKIADNVKSTFGFFLILNKKTSLLKNVYLLLEREQLLRISHTRINKKCPALVRYIPCGREAAAGSIECKNTSFLRDHQMFWQKSA